MPLGQQRNPEPELGVHVRCTAWTVHACRYVPLGVGEWFHSEGIRGNVIELDWWQSVKHRGTDVSVGPMGWHVSCKSASC